jgi:hypothetical protein
LIILNADLECDVTTSAAWFENVWAEREETVYRRLLGDIGTTIHTIPPKLFELMGVGDVDPRWTTHGVFECPPTPTRAAWTYITSGMSNPWGETEASAKPDGPSGLGFEFLIQSPRQSAWGITTLQWLMAVQILIATGAVQGELLEYYDRVPLGNSIDPKTPASALQHLIVAPPADLPGQFSIASGKVDLLLVIGISEAEREFARTQGGPELVAMLTHRGIFPLTDPGRPSAI